MKKLVFIMLGLLFLVGCGQTAEKKDEAEEVSGDVETKGVQLSVEAKEDDGIVQINMTVKNHTDKEKNFEFSSGQKYEIIITDPNGAEVYKYSKGRMFTQALQYLTLPPGESQTYQETWDMKSAGTELETGEYTVNVMFAGKAEGVKRLEQKQKFSVSE
ncbi:BsuPI-related putative proteinase inhibitor [Metabacillus idriensis]|uniref:BsuPI-related putative proteinase inhibitor n=1 Tax=Metabacillus idriensis TaxID=324768 RepID=UPI0008A9F4D5|nr:BsuPI-related putative proteinase inhibitor [Metabacillus idriensis]MCM3595268.1 BsuPI-related putative proteinase inhibitor [Metabacillus idriensis]OHR72475.1 hypothetical protein HMPREF3291_21880 [Bacillus sp. HMSC76G11]